MKPRFAFALLAFLALLALAVSLLEDEGQAEAGFDRVFEDSRAEMSFPVDTPGTRDFEPATATLEMALADDPWPRQELLIAQQRRQAELEELGKALDRARRSEIAASR